MKRTRGLFYTRDSGGQHEQTPVEYVRWAQREAENLALEFDASPEIIQGLIKSRKPWDRDVYLDWIVKGNSLSRPGLEALKRRVASDPTIACIFIPRRDRLARPDDALDGMQLEADLRRNGVDIVFMDRVVKARDGNKREELTETISAAIDYSSAGQFRLDLSRKVIYAQLNLARDGFSTGGRAPFGFRRVLVDGNRNPVRQLEDGEVVKMAGHHVVWILGPDEEIQLILRIVRMVAEMPVTRVAKILNQEGVPAPDSNRWRTDNGVLHRTRGKWNATTIRNIVEHPLLSGVMAFGRRSMGDQLRFSPSGPRSLNEDDRLADRRPKVVRNPPEDQIRVPTHFEPLVTPEKHQELLEILRQRGGTQRGKPRSRNPDQNPLGTRVIDINCSWPMYRIPHNGSFRYLCGLYSQSDAKECSHNHVDGPTAVAFVLSVLRQLLPEHREKILTRLRSLALKEQADAKANADTDDSRRKLAEIESKLEIVGSNLALAESPNQFRVVSSTFESLQQQRDLLAIECQRQEAASNVLDVESEISAAMDLFERLTDLASDPSNLPSITKLFAGVDARLFLRFEKQQHGNRTLNRLKSGVLTLGAAPAPIETYSGPTSKQHLASYLSQERALDKTLTVNPSTEGQSLGNVNRGDMI